MDRVFGALVVVVVVYLLTLIVVLSLNKIGPVNASVDGIFRRGDDRISFSGVGAVGAFLVVAGLAVVAIRWLSR